MITAYGFAISDMVEGISRDELASWMLDATKDEVRPFPLFEDYALTTLFMEGRYHFAVTHVSGI